MTLPQLDQKEEIKPENNLPNVHLMDYTLEGIGILPMSIRSKQKMVTDKGVRYADIMDLSAFTVQELRPIARHHKVASGVWINSANKSSLISALLKKRILLSQLEIKSPQAEIMDAVPDETIDQEMVRMFRRMISIMSEQAFQELKRKIREAND